MSEERAAEPERRKKVVIIHTGGTIFMRKTERGLDVGELIIPKDKNNDISNHIDFPVIDLFGKGGIDSSKMTLAHSKKLAEKIVELQNDSTVDGIVVTHGTDTMAETALELSYALKNLKKPVVLTGAQIPVEEKHSDGLRNLFRSIYLAAHAPHLTKVVICFGYKRKFVKTPPLLAGELKANPQLSPNFILDSRNAEKSSIDRQDAFLHEESKLLGTVSIRGGVNVKAGVPHAKDDAYAHFGFSKWSKRRTLERQSQRMPWFATGLVVETYGVGNAPDNVTRALGRRVRLFPVVAASQSKGKVNLTAYAAGLGMLEAGVLPSGGLTPLSASKRLSYLAAHRREVRAFARGGKVDYRKLLSTLYLSGGEFDSGKVRDKHAEILGVPIINEDLLLQRPFREAMQTAVRHLRRFQKPKEAARA